MGFLLPEMPEAYGGAGVSQAWQMVVQDELARIGMPAITGVHSITAHYILAYGTDEQKQRWLPKLVSGEHLAAIAMTEPGCGSDLKTLRTRARRDGDHYVIDGSKIFITNGSLCTLLVLVCRTGGDGAKGISLVVLETQDLPGFKVGRVLEKMGMHAVDTCELFFDQVRVPCNQLLGTVEGQGFAQLMGQLPYERLLIAVPGGGRDRPRAGAHRRLHAPAQGLRPDAVRHAAHAAEAGRGGHHRPRGAQLRARLHPAPGGRPARRPGGLHGQVVVHRTAVQGGRRLPADVRRLRLHDGVPDRADVCRRPRPAHLRRRQRGDEGPDRPAAVRMTSATAGRAAGAGVRRPLAPGRWPAACWPIWAPEVTACSRCRRSRVELPVSPPTVLGDASGALGLCLGIVSGVLQAHKSGQGCVVDAAIVDVVAMLGGLAQWIASSGGLGGPAPSVFHDSPFYDVYRCADGGFVTLGAIEPQFYGLLLKKLGLDDVDPAAQFDSAQWPVLKERVRVLFLSQPRQSWCKLLEGTDACFAPVLTLAEAAAHPHHRARGTFNLRDDGAIEIAARAALCAPGR
jgi:hypothetical protein